VLADARTDGGVGDLEDQRVSGAEEAAGVTGAVPGHRITSGDEVRDLLWRRIDRLGHAGNA
jgi:hypothetical protein